MSLRWLADVTVPEASAAWMDEQVARVLARIETLTREAAQLQAALGAREHEVSELRVALDIIDGRTRRHEAGQDTVRELRQAVSALEERVAEESSLCREQRPATEREQGGEHDSGQSLERALLELRDRVANLEQGSIAAGERQAHLGGGLAASDAAGQQLAARVAALAARLDAFTDAAHHGTSATGRIDDEVARIEARLRVVEVQAGELRNDRQRLFDDVTALQRVVEREESLANLIERHRVLRQRLEDGLASLDERVLTADTARAEASEERRLLLARFDSSMRRMDELAAQVEAQRGVLLDHFRRATVAAEEAGRRQSDEIDRQARAARELLVRLAERTGEAAQEQPL